MKFRQDTEDLNNFLNDIPYYENKDNFCLGNTLEDAGRITRTLHFEKKQKDKTE